jgi:2-polyprenyl-3-methyl-5-hydroxy-6-metoxy-1,4-benzoquinol methylase
MATPVVSNAQTFITGEIAHVFRIPLEYAKQLVARTSGRDHNEEWEFWKPQSEPERRLYYMTSRSYLFANAKHKMPAAWRQAVSVGDRVLDFGGGAGTISFSLATSGATIDYYDISLIQTWFVQDVACRYGLPVYVSNVWPPAERRQYDVVFASDVFEHIPDYHLYLKDIAEHMKPGARMFYTAPFKDAGAHVADRHGFANVCKELGLTRVSEEVYQKQ